MIIVLHSQLTECMIIMMVLRFLGDAWCSGIVEEWVKRIEHDKNNDVDYIIDTYMFGVIENDRERKSSDFHVSFYYRG